MKIFLVSLFLISAGCGDNIDVFPDADERTRCTEVDCGSPVYCEDPPSTVCGCFTADPDDNWAVYYCAAPCAECDSGGLRCNPATGRCWCVSLDGDVDACEPTP